MDRRFYIYLALSFFITLTMLMGGSSLLYSRTDPEVREDILSYVQERFVPVSGCEYKESLGFIKYEDSVWDKNNKFGLYIYAENREYFELAQTLVNANGGDWGYVLIPYNVKDRDDGRWARVFEQLRNKHLIPIIQLWDVDLADYEDQTKEAAEFLNGFVWPIRERYISVYNEPNSADFWYGQVDPAQYARILNYTVETFKEENINYFMLNGAFNVSAGNDSRHMDAFDFMAEMNRELPGIFAKLDGWASHPYPQPNFSGNPAAKGRWSIRAYEDELSYLKELGVSQDLPVFITETGWAHAEGEKYNDSFYEVDLISEYIRIAFEEVWLPDDRVRAVTPFTIKYEPPFDHFSWVNQDNVPYKHYDKIKSLEKVAGNPPIFREESLRLSGCHE